MSYRSTLARRRTTLGKAAGRPAAARRTLRGYQCACPPPQGNYRFDPTSSLSGLGDTCTVDASGARTCTAPTAGPQPLPPTPSPVFISPQYVPTFRRVQVPRLVCNTPAVNAGGGSWPVKLMGLGLLPAYVNDGDGFFFRRWKPVGGGGTGWIMPYTPAVPTNLPPITPKPIVTPPSPPPPAASSAPQCRVVWDEITVPGMNPVPPGYTYFNGSVIPIATALAIVQNQAPPAASVSVETPAPTASSSPAAAPADPGSSPSSIISSMPWYGWAAIAGGAWLLLRK